MRRLIILLVFYVITLGSSSIVNASDDYVELYSKSELQQASNIYSKNLREIWKYDLVNRLLPAEQQVAKKIALDLPLIGAHRHPFDYYAEHNELKVTIPIFSVKFWDDVAIALAWLESRGCSAESVSDYVGAIRYQSPSKFTGNRYPQPQVALNIPHNALDNHFVNDVSGKLLKSTIYFLMAHELAHILYEHKGYNLLNASQAQKQEIEADRFALNVMRRIGVVPAGMVAFFTVVSRFESAPGDFDSTAEFEKYLQSEATHPLSSDRLATFADYIEQNVDSFTKGQSNPVAWRPKILKMASEIRKIGEILDDRKMREFQRLRSLTVNPEELKKACTQ